MDLTHFHLLFTHLPIFGTLIGIGILGYGLLIKKTEVQKIALVIFILMALVTIPIVFSGEEAEETVEHLATVSEQAIENHEELAEKAALIMYGIGVLALLNLLMLIKNAKYLKSVSIITLIASIVAFGFIAKVGNLGGQIRHSEIREAGNSVQYNGEEPRSHEAERDD